MKKATKNKKFQNSSNAQVQDFLVGGGELGELIRTKDWSKTPLGPVENWPKSLRTIVRIMLTSQQPIWIGWGPSLIKLYNDPYKSIVGGKHPKALGQPVSVVWRDIWKDIEPLLKQVMGKNQGTYSESQLLIMERNGYPEETYYTFSYSPVPGDEGGVEGMICANTDDTQRVIGERQLASLRDLAAQTADAKTIDEACILSAAALQANTKDIPFGIIYRVDQAKKTVSLAGTIAIDQTHSAVPETIAWDSDAIWPIAKVLKTKEVCLVSDAGKYFDDLPKGAWDQPPHQAVAVPIMQPGYVAGILVVGLNPYRLFDDNYRRYLNLVSGQIASSLANAQAYEEEKKRAEALAEIDRAKTLFFSNVSHEFRTPLTLMLGPVQDMLNEPLDAVQRKDLEVVYRNGLRLQKLVNSLLDFSRIEEGRMQANYTPTNLSTYTSELASNFRSAIEQAGMQLIVETPPLSEDVYVDRNMWEKIVLNLLSNAFKFTFKGEIGVGLTENKTYVTLKIRDTGEGIPSQDLPHIFDRFKRVEGAKSRTFEGSGIGLSLVQELVHLHKGNIKVESTVGKGTSFRVKIPKGTKHLPQDHIQSAPTLQSTALGAQAYIEEVQQWLSSEVKGNEISLQTIDDTHLPPKLTDKPRIVLADDNADMRNYIQRLLAGRFDVKATSNGKEALKVIQEEIPELLITDVMMPEMDGFALMAALKADTQTAHIPVIMLSARAGEEAKVEGIEAGADDYLVKPFSANELIARVSTIIATGRTRRESEKHLSELFMQAPAIIVVLRGPEFIFELANPMYLQFVGKDKAIIGKTVMEALPEIKDQGFIQLLEDVYKTGKPFVGKEIPIKLDRHGTGKLEEMYINFVYQPYKDAKGNIQGIFGHGVDVTEQVRARQKVEETQKQLELALSAGSVGIWVWDIQNNRVITDERVAFYFGVDPQKATTEGLPMGVFEKAIHAEDRLRIKELTAQAVKTGENYHAEYRVMGSDGQMRWMVVRGKVEQDAKGNPVRFPGVLVDITERIQAEEALRQSELRFKTYAETLPQMAFMAAPEGNIIYYNQRWYDFVAGMKDTEGWGWKDKPIHHPDDLQRTIDRWTESIRTGKPYEIEYRLRRHDGEYRWHLGRAVPVRDSNGNIDMWLGTNTDIHEQKQAEEALRKSEEYYKKMTDNTPVITWITQPDASCSYLNKQWYEFTGQTPATGLGFGWLEVIHPDDDVKSREIFFEANEKHIPFSLEYRLKGKDGQYRWHLDSGLPKFDDQGNFEGFVGSVIDIHERRLAEERLRKSEERFRTLADNISNLCWMANADGWIYWYNSRWYEYTGTDPKEMEGWGWQSVHDPQVLPQVLEKWKACIATGKPLDMVFPLRRADGVFRPFLTRAMPVKDENGNILHWFGTNTDITALREAEEKLSYQKSLLEAQQEVSPLGILVVSPKGKILTYNHRFANMWHFPQKIMETELDKVALESAQEQLNDPDAFMRKVLNCYKKQVQNHEKLYFKDGRIFDRYGSPVKDEEGTYYGYVWFFQDITEQEHLAKQKDEFIGIASHELKTPVTSIKGSIQIIDRLFTDQSYEMIGNFLHKAELHVDKLTGLINDLLDVSKIQAGKLQYNFSEFTANDIIQDCVEEVSHQAKKHTIIVQGDTSIVMYGDKLRLEQVVSNLLTNAIKYSPEADEVIVEIAKENESLKISVTDFGIGIPEKKLANVFDRFFRVEQNAHQFQGLGIGLYICAEIIKRHRGKMQVKSTEGKGSTFYFTLPLNKPTAH